MTDFGFSTVRDFLALPADVEVGPGPPSYEGTADTVGRAVVITVGSGPGLTDELIFEDVMVSLDVAGEQGDYDSAESLAKLCDAKMLTLDHSQTVAGVRIKAATRAGGRPVPFTVDDGDRWHFSCSYVWSVRSSVDA